MERETEVRRSNDREGIHDRSDMRWSTSNDSFRIQNFAGNVVE